MRVQIALLLLATVAPSQSPIPKLAPDDAIRLREFYGLASRIEDQLWPDWDKVPAPLILVTDDGEFLTHHPAPPKEFTKIGDDVDAGPRKFPINFLATFPAFGPPSVMVVGEPKNTESKTTTPWLFAVMHEHFHQLQNAQPRYYPGLESLGLSRGDQTGMWMLNYPFPYGKPEVAQGFSHLRDLLLAVLAENRDGEFATLAKRYVVERKKFLAQLSSDDHKYFSFQLWQEGVARYTQIKAAEAAGSYRPSEECAGLPDFESFAA